MTNEDRRDVVAMSFRRCPIAKSCGFALMMMSLNRI